MKYINIILAFSFMVVVIFFYSLLIYQIGDEYVLAELDNVTTQIAPSMGVSGSMQTHIHSLYEDYQNLNVPYDLGFVITFILFFSSSIWSAHKSKELGWLSFFGVLTIGFMIFLFTTGFIVTIKDWFVLNLIENFLGFELATVPIFNYYINNMGMINLFWFVVLMVVNKLNFTFARDTEDDVNVIGGNEQ